MNTPPTQRLFFALWPDQVLRQRLAELARQVATRPVPPANLHLTLVFLGSQTAAQRDCAMAAAQQVRGAPFELVLDYLGGWSGPRIQWLGSRQAPQALLDLVAELNRHLAACGFTPERRPFAPHVTLARKVRQPRVQLLDAPIHWPAREFVLAESVSTDEGVRYPVLARWPLG